MKKISILASAILMMLMMYSCGNYGDTSDLSGYGDDSGTFTNATITHEGFDFAKGVKAPTDGEVVTWCPNDGNNPNYANNSGYLWWRSAYEIDPDNKTIISHYGEVDLASIKTAPSTWDVPDQMYPLINNHCYVIKCLNGYAKFRVIETHPDSEFWEVDIEYAYSTTTTF